MAEQCEICGGRELINLPIRRKLSAIQIEEMSPQQAAYKTYPCPECANRVDLERVAILQCQSVVDERFEKTGALAHIVKDHAHGLVDLLIRSGCINTREVERTNGDGLQPGKIQIRSRLGVVSPAVVASIEGRALGQGMILITAIIREAQEQIDIWGSEYGRAMISKEDAKRMIRDAGARVLGKAKEMVKN